MSKKARGDVCFYCGSRVFPPGSAEAIKNKQCMATRDHVFPQYWRTITCNIVSSTGNIVTACHACNNVKGGYPHELFIYFLGQHRGTPLFNPAEFKKFVFGCALAGFRVAKADARRRLARHQPPALPPRGPQGRFTKRDLLRGARA